mmetsp:Transcript_1080/g.3688  ORF Transcript_1080/g.3688 Transcript_1080/m.3688 type:complete len:403 (-) Transcript_1080:1371-2579(-)
MTDHSISSHAPPTLLDEEWENDLLSDDEDFAPFTHTSHYAPPTQQRSSVPMYTTSSGATIMTTQNATNIMAPLSESEGVFYETEAPNGGQNTPLASFGSHLEHLLVESTPMQSDPAGELRNQNVSPNLERGGTTTTLSTSNAAMVDNSRRRSLQALRSPASSPSNGGMQKDHGSAPLPNSPVGNATMQQQHKSLAQSQSRPHKRPNPSMQVSRAIDAYFNHSARNFTHSTVLMTQHRNKNANVALSRTGLVDLEPVNIPKPPLISNDDPNNQTTQPNEDTIMVPQLMPPLHTRNGMATSTYSLDNHYSQRYHDVNYSANNIYSNYQISSNGGSSAGGSHVSSHVPAALSEFEDESFMYNSHGMGGNGSSAGPQNALSGNWNDIALDQLWQDTLGGGGHMTIR